MGGFLKDVRQAVRSLLRRPGFTVVVVLTLALGVGADTAVFSVLNGVLLRPLGYPRADRIVVLRDRDRQSGRLGDPSAPNAEDWKALSTSFRSVGLVWSGAWALTGDDLPPEQVLGGRVSAELFQVLGIEPELGRFLRPEENVGDPAVVVISDGLWRSRFGGDPNVVGRTLVLDGRRRRIVGVLPPVPMPLNRSRVELLDGKGSDHVWIPLDEDDPWYSRRASHFTLVMARLRDGISIERAGSELSRVATTLEDRYPDANTGLDAAVVSLREEVVGDVRSELLLVLGAATLVLLVACANLTSLLLARGMERRRENAVRAALGAGRGRLLRRALIEVTVLGLAGGLVGLTAAWWGTGFLLALTPGDLPLQSQVGMDASVLTYTLAVALLASLGASMLPALRLGRGDVRRVLAGSGGRSGSAGAKLGSLRSALVVGQLSLAVLLLAGSGLLLRTLVKVRSVDPGARTENVLAVPFYLTGARYGDARTNRATQVAVRDALAGLPGVDQAVLAYDTPVATTWFEGFTVVGRPTPEPGQVPRARFRPVGEGYFEALDIGIVSGRSFNASDRLGTPGAVIVNEALAERYFPGEDALGRRIATGTPHANFPEAPAEWTIVGVSRNVGFTGPRGSVQPAFYVPVAQFPVAYLQVLATTSVPPASLIQAARKAVWSVDPDLPLPDVAPLSDQVRHLVAPERFVAVLAVVFAVVALLVAAVGVYGVMSYTVTARRAETGIRLALGATPGAVVAEVLGRSFLLATAGLGLGMTGAVVLGRTLSAFLFRVQPWDPTVLGAVTAVLLGVVAVASLLPARRAAGTDPIEALRAE